MHAIKGMVQYEGHTYRIVRVSSCQYDVIRLLNDECIGSFSSSPQLAVTPKSADAGLLREIARTAVRGAKTSWVGRLEIA